MSKNTKKEKVVLLKTVKIGDEFHPPDKRISVSPEIADELFDQDAAEPAIDIQPKEKKDDD